MDINQLSKKIENKLLNDSSIKDVKIIDNNSTNGIYINNEIKSEHKLKSGDKIQIGKYSLLLTEVTK